MVLLHAGKSWHEDVVDKNLTEHNLTTCQPKRLTGHVSDQCKACLPAMSSVQLACLHLAG